MKKIIIILITGLVFITTGCTNKPENYADLVIKNAKVYTVDPKNVYAEAIAIKGEWIIAVTTNTNIEQYIDETRTKVIDAEGNLVLPGFNDAHVHWGPVDVDYVELRYITNPDVITEKVKERVKEVAPGILIYGGHWEHEMFTDKQWPTKTLLDEVSPDNPVVLKRADGHSALVNRYVLKTSGITKDTPNPFGGEIVKDPVTGEPTGILKETAMDLIKTGAKNRVVPTEEKGKKEWEGWKKAFEKASSLGVTSIQHAGEGNGELYIKLKEAGFLSARMDISRPLPKKEEKLVTLDSLRKKFPPEGNWIRFGYLKGFMDGTLGSGTAMFYEPFEDEPGKAGLPQMSYEELEKRVLAADEMGFQIGIHAIGSKANTWILNAFEKAREVNGMRDSRHRSEHAQILIEKDIPRFTKLGVIASMQPTHCITDKRFCEKRIGPERSKFAYPWRSLLDANAHVAFGTDYSVEPLNPMEGLYAAVTRKDRVGEEGEGWIPEQKITMAEAIELYTLGAAYAQFMEDRKGMLKKGYLADVVILDNDLFSIPEDQIMQTRVMYTMVGGQIVYQKEENP